MSRNKPCPRLWEVEAARTGQLQGAPLRALHDHLATVCPDCTRASEQLDSLGRRLQAHEAPEDEVSLRRLRQSTLERAYALRARPEGRFRLPLLAAAFTVLGVAVSLVAAWQWNRHATARPPLVVVTPGSAPASWSQHRDRNVERVELSEGVFSLVVQRRPSDPRVIVRIPEGEIEDLGTIFSVTVRAGRTTRVAVSQGSIVVRRSGLPELRLLEGSVWESVSAPREVVLPPAAPELVPEIVHKDPPVVAQRVKRVKRPVAANSGSGRELLDEDAAYLRLVELVRQQRPADAMRAAADYLARYPDGFRRGDALRVLRASVPDTAR